MTHEILHRFRKFITDNNLVSPGDRILLAVSGGIDSMVMAHLFIRSEYKTGVAHCNFSLRSEESDRDEEMVEKFAFTHNLPFYSVRFDTKSYAAENGLSVQMAARELRYDWFEKIRRENNFSVIGVAHNLNDNIETLLINLTRGTGPAGLSGMKPLNGRIIRPLLFAKRKEIEEYQKQEGIQFREDMSNADTKYHRNKIRHVIIPALMEINPSVESTLNETAGRFSEISSITGLFTDSLREKVTRKDREESFINIGLLKPYINNKSIIFGLFRPFGITDATLADLLGIIKGRTGSILSTKSHTILKDRKEIIIRKSGNEKKQERKIYSLHDLECLPGVESVRSVKISSRFRIPVLPGTITLDKDKLVFPLVVRKWNYGDYFHPLGMEKRKKLSDYFTDRKYSLFEKDNTQILESGGKIVCILGDRIDNMFRIGQDSKNALIINCGKEICRSKPRE